jgi:ATP-dependent RNA helicase DHX36
MQFNGKMEHLSLIVDACSLNGVFAVHGNKQVVIPLSLQRRVEGLVQEHLDRALLPFDKDGGKTESGSEKAEPVNLDEKQDALLDRSVMEKVLQRKSIRMRNFQRSWQV